MVTGGARGPAHGANFGLGISVAGRLRGRRYPAGLRPGAGNSEIVDGPVDRQFADGAAGKRSGLTTKLSAVMARRVPFILMWAASPRGSVEESKSSGANSPSIRRRLATARRHAPFRSARREIESWVRRQPWRESSKRESKPIGIFDARTGNRPRRSPRRKPSVHQSAAPACTRCRRVYTAPVSTLPSAPLRTEPLWDR